MNKVNRKELQRAIDLLEEAKEIVERIKNEINQRRIRRQSGGGSNLLDASDSPMSMNEDFFFPVSAEGRGSDGTTLAGGQNLGENYQLVCLKLPNGKNYSCLKLKVFLH